MRTDPNLNDVAIAFDQLGIYVHELEDYVHQVEQNSSLYLPPLLPAYGKGNVLQFSEDSWFPPIMKIEPPVTIEEVIAQPEPMEGLCELF